MGKGRAEGTQTRNGVKSSADMRTMNRDSWVVSYILGVTQERASFSYHQGDCVSQSGKVSRSPEPGNSGGRSWVSWRLGSGDQSLRNGMEVDFISV